MLNEKGIRELCYVAKITNIMPIEKADRIELVQINDGWVCIAKKEEFKIGDLCVYFEIDSKLPQTDWSAFLESKKYKVKTMKLGKFGVISQGLALPVSAFGWTLEGDEIKDGRKTYKLGDFLTKTLGVVYSVDEDNERKDISVSKDVKYKKLPQRYPKLFQKRIIQKIYKRKIGKIILYAILGHNKSKKFPTHFPYVKKSDEERIENMTYILKDKTPFVKTTKIDGTSSLYILERKPLRNEFYVCSRNVRQLTPKQKTYHSDNVYWSVEYKYHIKAFLEDMLKKNPKWKYVALQGETAGVGEDGGKIQGDPHKFGELRFFGYNFIDSEKGRWNSVEAKNLAASYGIEWVPIVDENYILPDDLEEFKRSADGLCEAIGASGNREGYVYRNSKDPNISFKNVSRQYLLKHNQ